MAVFMASASREQPLDSDSSKSNDQTTVSAFLTKQSFANFAAMTGGITAAWHALRALDAELFGNRFVPFAFSLLWLAVSLSISSRSGLSRGQWAQAVFLGLLNALVLFGAVVGLVPAAPAAPAG